VIGCCSNNFKDCVSWCGDTTNQALCNACGQDVVWIEPGPKTECNPRWQECTHDVESCCEGLICHGESSGYKQCLAPKDIDLPTHSPTKAPIKLSSPPTSNPTSFPNSSPTLPPITTTAPTSSPNSSPVIGCCSNNFKDCVSWCGDTTNQALCNACGQDVVWIEPGPKTECNPRWQECTHDVESCCEGLICHGESSGYKQCLAPKNICASWCSPNQSPWSQKCIWDRCKGCAECN